MSTQGHIVGTICLLDLIARPKFGASQRRRLMEFARISLEEIKYAQARYVRRLNHVQKHGITNGEGAGGVISTAAAKHVVDDIEVLDASVTLRAHGENVGVRYGRNVDMADRLSQKLQHSSPNTNASPITSSGENGTFGTASSNVSRDSSLRDAGARHLAAARRPERISEVTEIDGDEKPYVMEQRSPSAADAILINKGLVEQRRGSLPRLQARDEVNNLEKPPPGQRKGSLPRNTLEQRRGSGPGLVEQRRGSIPILVPHRRGSIPDIVEQNQTSYPTLIEQRRGSLSRPQAREEVNHFPKSRTRSFSTPNAHAQLSPEQQAKLMKTSRSNSHSEFDDERSQALLDGKEAHAAALASKLIAQTLGLDFVYLLHLITASAVLLDGAVSAPSSSSISDYKVLGSYGMPDPEPTFDVPLHQRALGSRAGFVYRNPVEAADVSSKKDSAEFEIGILLPLWHDDDDDSTGDTSGRKGESSDNEQRRVSGGSGVVLAGFARSARDRKGL